MSQSLLVTCHSVLSDVDHRSEQLVERLSDQSLLPRAVRRQAQDGNSVRGHDRVFARVALLLLLAVAVILPAVDLNGEDQAPCHPRVHPEVEGAIREHEGALLLAEATSVRQRVPEEYFGLIAKASVPGFRERLAQALVGNVLGGRAPTVGPLGARVAFERLTVGVVEDIENGDDVRLDDGARVVHFDVIEQCPDVSAQADAAVRGDDDEPVFGARHDDVRHGVRVVELARGGPVVRVEDRG